jgi:hypothetical protein
MAVVLQVSHLYSNVPSMHTDEGELLKRIGDTFIITGDIYCNAHTNAAARSAAGCAIQVSGLATRLALLPNVHAAVLVPMHTRPSTCAVCADFPA